MSKPDDEAQISTPIAVLGAGSWGTALAIQLARAHRPTRLWGRQAADLAEMAKTRINTRYLPHVRFPDSLTLEKDLSAAIRGVTDILIAIPSHAFRETLVMLAPHLTPGQRVAWATKGFELTSGLLPHQIAHAVLPHVPVAVVSGPTFAREVGEGLPTAMTVASDNALFAQELARSLSGQHFRAYTSPDIIGVEVGGATKNVLAIATGLADGMGFGANTRAALITRGLVEMTRLGTALGARADTFMGLSALGDLVLTCTDDQSRNRRFGLAMAQGLSPDAALADIGQVVEGFQAAAAIHTVATRLQIDMPIAHEVYRVLYEHAPLKEAVAALMGRDLKAE